MRGCVSELRVVDEVQPGLLRHGFAKRGRQVIAHPGHGPVVVAPAHRGREIDDLPVGQQAGRLELHRLTDRQDDIGGRDQDAEELGFFSAVPAILALAGARQQRSGQGQEPGPPAWQGIPIVRMVSTGRSLT